MAMAREHILYQEFNMDQAGYDEIFYNAFDKMTQLYFGEFARLIYFYLYERKNPDGSINILKDDEGNELVLSNANDLWEVLERLKSLGESDKES
jgi:hypothetical protein